jgi:hypothetical protein
MNWKPMGAVFPQAFKAPEIKTRANAPTTLYHEPTLNKYHTHAARALSREYEKYIDGICTAISDAIGKWMLAASIVSVNVAGPVGTMLPGGVSAPQLYPMIMANAPKKGRSEVRYSQSIAAAVSDAWNGWHQGLSGILNYPGFNGMPMVNTPAPLISFVSEGESALAPHSLGPAIQRNLNDPGALHAKTLFDAVANAFFIQFQAFKAATLIIGVTVTAAPAPPVPAGMAASAAGAAMETPEEPADAANEETDAGETGGAEEETSTKETDIGPEGLAPPPPCVVGMVIPTPGNFV